MLRPALVKDADDKLALACAAVAKVGEGATPEEQQVVNDIIYTITAASRMLMELVRNPPPSMPSVPQEAPIQASPDPSEPAPLIPRS